MSDTSYQLEIRLAAKTGWHTPAEAEAYYWTKMRVAHYARVGVTVHYWNSPDKIAMSPKSHDDIVNYILGKARAGTGSVNYVLSDYKISLLVYPDDVAWASQNGNPTTVSIEFDPHLSAEGYKKAGWLIDQLEQRYGRSLTLYPHRHWFATSCPGNLDLNRMRAEADKWKRGEYDAKPQPAPTPLPAKADLVWEQYDAPAAYVLNKDTNLWAFDSPTWNGIQAVKPFSKGTKVDVFGRVINRNLNAVYYLTEYSYKKGIANGFNKADLNAVVLPPTPPEPPAQQQPQPQPAPTPENKPMEPTEHDKQQDQRLSVLESCIEAVKALLAKLGIKL